MATVPKLWTIRCKRVQTSCLLLEIDGKSTLSFYLELHKHSQTLFSFPSSNWIMFWLQQNGLYICWPFGNQVSAIDLERDHRRSDSVAGLFKTGAALVLNANGSTEERHHAALSDIMDSVKADVVSTSHLEVGTNLVMFGLVGSFGSYDQSWPVTTLSFMATIQGWTYLARQGGSVSLNGSLAEIAIRSVLRWELHRIASASVHCWQQLFKKNLELSNRSFWSNQLGSKKPLAQNEQKGTCSWSSVHDR